ncbi:MAG: SoxR reducing system RseC family protein [Sphaerochaetaceae bacterium]
MYEVVTVAKCISSDKVEVVCNSAACKGCKGSAFCNTKGKRFAVWNQKKLPLQEGQEVEIFLQPSRTIIGTLLTLIAPLLLFPVGYYLAEAIGSSEGISFLVALGGIALGFLAVWAYFRKQQNRYLPIVASILSEEKEK